MGASWLCHLFTNDALLEWIVLEHFKQIRLRNHQPLENLFVLCSERISQQATSKAADIKTTEIRKHEAYGYTERPNPPYPSLLRLLVTITITSL